MSSPDRKRKEWRLENLQVFRKFYSGDIGRHSSNQSHLISGSHIFRRDQPKGSVLVVKARVTPFLFYLSDHISQ